MNKKIRFLLFALFVYLTITIVLALVCNGSNVDSRDERTQTIQIQPNQIEDLEDNARLYSFAMNQDEDYSMAIQFLSTHQFVKVYADGKEVYKLWQEKSFAGSNPGSTVNIVELPAKCKQVQVEIRSIYQTNPFIPTFYYGDATHMYKSYIRSDTMGYVLSWLLIAGGIVMLVYYCAFLLHTTHSTAMFHFGIFTVIIGLWSLNETDTAMLLFSNRTGASYAGYTMLILMAIPFVQFVRASFHRKESRYCRIYCTIAAIAAVVFPILHMTDVREYKKNAVYIHVLMVFGLLYLIYANVKHIRQYGLDSKARAHLIAFIALSTSIIVDFVAYYNNYQQTDVLAKFGFILYIAILAKESTAEAIQQMQEGKKAEFYHELAISDVLTGLYNRNAYEEWEQAFEMHPEPVMYVTLDLNCLKKCNDTLGHAAGDRYIVEAAALIRTVFGHLGKCYRIGGDEFCVVIMDWKKVNIEKCIQMLHDEQNLIEIDNFGANAGLAVGYAVYSKEDNSFAQTKQRADEMMYRNKGENKRE